MNLCPPLGANYARSFTAATLGHWIAETPADADHVLIDMHKVQFIDPLGLVAIAAVVEDAANWGRQVKFVQPLKREVCTYMSRMHLGDCLESYGVTVSLPMVNEWDTGHRLFELQRFDSACGDEFAERVFGAVKAAGSSQSDAASFYKGIAEVVGNVAEHSGAGGGWAAMQVMPNQDGLINFAVADAGHGLEITLSRQHWIIDHMHAMEMAFERSVSGTGRVGRGTGLDDLHKRVRQHNGHLLAWSGNAIGLSSVQPNPIECYETSAAFPGTVVYASFKPESREVSR